MKTENKEEKITDEEWEEIKENQKEFEKNRPDVGWTPFGCLPERFW